MRLTQAGLPRGLAARDLGTYKAIALSRGWLAHRFDVEGLSEISNMVIDCDCAAEDHPWLCWMLAEGALRRGLRGERRV